jgi:hypothetical protein
MISCLVFPNSQPTSQLARPKFRKINCNAPERLLNKIIIAYDQYEMIDVMGGAVVLHLLHRSQNPSSLYYYGISFC